jgi:hypothetical protein
VLTELAEEVATAVEAALLLQAVLSNLGIPGLVFSPEQGAAAASVPGISRDDRAEIKASLMAKTTGRRRGEPIVLSRPTGLEQFHANLDALDLSAVWDHVLLSEAGAWRCCVFDALGGGPAVCLARPVFVRRPCRPTAGPLRQDRRTHGHTSAIETGREHSPVRCRLAWR